METDIKEVMQKMKTYIDENICSIVSVEQLKDQFDLETSELYENFVKIYDISPKQYLSEKKMDKLLEILLETGDQEITYYYAHVLGFKTAAGITNFVKRRTGLNFTEFRLKFMEDASLFNSES